jgi:hypothetical protein
MKITNLQTKKRIMKRTIAAMIAMLPALMMSACAHNGSAPTTSGAQANVDLRVSQGPNDDSRIYAAVSSYEVPQNHVIGDKLFPYEGIGWENDLIGYRIYLDERAVGDVFGKKISDVALPGVDYRKAYHEMAPWGMDVMHVGPSMGIGGLGLYRDGKLARFGKGANLKAEILQPRGKQISFMLSHANIPLTGGGSGNVQAVYSMNSSSPLTWVKVRSTLPANMLASGLVTHPQATTIAAPQSMNGWSYIAHWGSWSQNKDELGIALFYKTNEAERMPEENETNPLRFKISDPQYAYAAAWSKGPQAIDTEAEFRAFLEKMLKEVAGSKRK